MVIQNEISSESNYSCGYLESIKNFGMINIKKVISPLSSSGPLNYVVKSVNKSLALANYVKCASFIPVFGRTLESAGEILGMGAFLNLVVLYIPFVNKENLDEEGLKKSIDLSTYFGEIPNEKWVNRVVKHVKLSLDNTYSQGAIRAELESYLVNKKLPKELATNIAKSIVIKQKAKDKIEWVYLTLLLVPGFSTVYTTLEKWQFITFTANLSTKMGGIPILRYLAQIGMRKIALYGALTGLTLKFGHNSYKLYKAQVKVLNAKATDLEKAREGRTKEIWATFTSGLTVVGIAVPLIVKVDSGALLGYEAFGALVGLANSLRS